jgi:hypothetical protein
MGIIGYISEILEHPLIEPDPIDEVFLFLIMEGNTSAYSICSCFKKEPEIEQDSNETEVDRGMSYKNVHKRLTRLHKSGLLNHVDLDTVNIHGRKDYEVSSIGLVYLFSDLADHHLDRIILSYPNNSLFENFIYLLFERDTLKNIIYEKNTRSRWTFSLFNLLESYLEEISAKTRYWLNPGLLEKFGYNSTLPLSKQDYPNPQVYPPINVLEFQLKWTITSFLTRIVYMNEESISWASSKSDENSKYKERRRLVELLAKDKRFMNSLKKAESNFRKGYEEMIEMEST